MARPSKLRPLTALWPGTTASTRRLATTYIRFRIGKHYNLPVKQKVNRDLMMSWQTDCEICGIVLPPCGKDWECEASLQMKRCLACKPDRILICTLREGQPAPIPSPASSPGPEAWSIVANLTAITTSSSKRCLCEKPSDFEMIHTFSKYVYFCAADSPRSWRGCVLRRLRAAPWPRTLQVASTACPSKFIPVLILHFTV